MSVCLPVYLSIYLSVCLSVFLSVCLSVCMYVSLSVYLFVSLSVCPSVKHIYSNFVLLYTIQAKQQNTTKAHRAWFYLQLLISMWMSLETIFCISLAVTLPFDLCKNKENTDLQYVLNEDVCLSACLSVCLSVCLSFYLSVCLSVFLSVSLSVCRSVCLSVCLSVK